MPMRGPIVAAPFLVLTAASPASAATAEIRVQAEGVTRAPLSAGSVITELSATGGRGQLLYANGSLSFTESLSVAEITVRAKGEQCSGAPQLALSIDGVKRATTPVVPTVWTTYKYTLPAQLPAGPHTFKVEYLNDFRSPDCDRNLRFDWVGASSVANSTTGVPAAPVTAPAVSYATNPAGWFAPNSFWRTPLPANAPISPSSAALVNSLKRDVLQNTWAPWIQYSEYSSPVYQVGADQPRVRVQLDKDHAPLQNQLLSVPIPPDAKPATGSDGHMVIYQASTDTMWEFWRLYKNSAGSWHAGWGGRMENVSKDDGRFDGANAHLGATATSLPLVGGMMTVEELKARYIPHALALAIPNPSPKVVWPAQRGDGTNLAADALPSGTRLRLNPALNIDALPLKPAMKAIAKAAQTYGIILRDRTYSSVNFYAEVPDGPRKDAYQIDTGVFGSQWPDQAMREFPWDHLQVVAPPVQ